MASATSASAPSSTYTYLTINYNGSVGIGTVNPASRLHVNGNATIGYSTATAAPSNGLLVNGSVGIGTTAPVNPLHVIGKIRLTNDLEYATTGGTVTGIIFGDTGNLVIRQQSTAGIQFQTLAGGNIMTLTTGSNVGIGTATPSNKLQVVGGVTATSFTGSLLGTATTASYVQNAASASYALSSSYALNASTATSSSFATSAASATSASYATFAATASSADNFNVRGTLTATTIVVQTITSSQSWVTGSTKFGSINSNTHEFTGSVSISGSSTFGLNVNAGALYVSASGNVGIGSTSPAYKLEVIGTQRTSGNFYFFNTVTNVASNFSDQRGAGFDASTGQFQVAANATTALELSRFGTSGSVLNIRNAGTSVSNFGNDGGAWFSGNVGIGSTSPGYKLDIVENVNSFAASVTNTNTNGSAGGLRIIKSNGGQAALYIDNTGGYGNAATILGGSVGIGTTSPQSKLEVGGIGSSGTSDYGALTLSSGSSGLTLGWDSTNNRSYIYSRTSGVSSRPIIINETLYVVGYGSVGMGTTSPTAQLHISSSTAASMLRVDTAARAGALFVSGSGNVGIGMSTPTGSTLTVNGNVWAVSYTGSFSGSFSGTTTSASYATFAASSSYAATASFSRDFTVGNTFTFDATLTDYASVAASSVGSNNLFTQNTGSFTSAFFKYTCYSASFAARAGEVIAVWNGTSVQYTDFSTVDVGNTAPVTASVSIVTGQVQFNMQTNTSGWTIKSMATFI